MAEKSSYSHIEKSDSLGKYATYEQAFIAGEITETEFLFYTDPVSPTPLEARGGLRRSLASFLAVISVLGLGASIALLYEEWVHINYPFSELSCSINKFISCTDGISSWQGHLLFGTPNALWGTIIFLGMLFLSLWLLSGKTLTVWLWRIMAVGSALGIVMVLWFMQVSLFTLRSLCPFCMVVWTAVIWAFWLILAANLRLYAQVGESLGAGKQILIRYWFLGALLSCFMIALLSVSVFGSALFTGF